MAQRIQKGKLPTRADLLLEEIDETGGQIRLSELRDTSSSSSHPIGGSFEQAVIELVERGEIGLFPVGDVVAVKRQ